jgi:transposase
MMVKIAALGLRVPVTLVLDNVRDQKCKLVQQLAEELGIELLFLPSYSPNLTLIEGFWKFVKKKVLDSKYYDNVVAFQAVIEGCIADAQTKYHEELDSLLTQHSRRSRKLSYWQRGV